MTLENYSLRVGGRAELYLATESLVISRFREALVGIFYL